MILMGIWWFFVLYSRKVSSSWSPQCFSPICRDPQLSLDLLPPPAAWVFFWSKPQMVSQNSAESSKFKVLLKCRIFIGIHNSELRWVKYGWFFVHIQDDVTHESEWIPKTSRSLTQPRSRTSLLEPFVHWLGFLMLASEHENPGPRHFQAKNVFWIVRRIHI